MHETGGHTFLDKDGNIKIVFWKPGPLKENKSAAGIPPFNGIEKPSPEALLDYWHVHTEKSVFTVDDDGNMYHSDVILGPSPDDKLYQNDINNGVIKATAIQVDTYGGKVVNFYDGKTEKYISISYKAFLRLKN